MVVDACTLFNEIELLKLRFRILDSVVDHFVVIEGSHTHSGVKKRSTMLDHYKELRPWWHRIRYSECDLSKYDQPWDREGAQREHIANIVDEYDSDTMVMVSDVDEIPNPDKVGQIGVFQQKMCYFYLNVEADYPWHGTIAQPKGEWQSINSARQALHRGQFAISEVVEDGGWHFSALGGPKRVHEKLKAYAHQEYNTPGIHELLELRMRRLGDIFGRGEQYHVVPIDESYPDDIRLNQALYADFIY